jgi:2,3-bisphosphoglycerate-independent phosphoglycerate mutase
LKEGKLLYVVIDGLGDRPISELGNRTPLEAAETPNLDRLAPKGKLGLMYTVGKGIAPESDVAVVSILGYDPAKFYTGRGPLEAFGANMIVNDGDLALRCNFATVDSTNKILDRRVGRNLTTSEATELGKSINSEIRLETVPSRFEFKCTVGYRAVLVIRKSNGSLSGNITNTDPAYTHIGGFGVAKSKLGAETSEECKPMDATDEANISAKLVNEFVEKTHTLLEYHPTNIKRESSGKLKANAILMRDAGNRLPTLFDINKKYNIDFASLVDMPVEKGIATLAGMATIEIPPPSGNLSRDSQLKASRLLENLQYHDAFYIHIKGPDEPAHDGNFELKKRSIEIVDAEFFGKLRGALDAEEILTCVSADHSTPCKMKSHSDDPVPLLIVGRNILGDGLRKFCERECAKGSLGVLLKGSELMPILVSQLKQKVNSTG